MITKSAIQEFAHEMTDHGWTPFKFRQGWKKCVLTSTPFNLDGIIQWYMEIGNVEYTYGLTFIRISPTVAHIVVKYNAEREARKQKEREALLKIYDVDAIYGCLKIKQKKDSTVCYFESGDFIINNLSAIRKSVAVYIVMRMTDVCTEIGRNTIAFSRYVPSTKKERYAETI